MYIYIFKVQTEIQEGKVCPTTFPCVAQHFLSNMNFKNEKRILS